MNHGIHRIHGMILLACFLELGALAELGTVTNGASFGTRRGAWNATILQTNTNTVNIASNTALFASADAAFSNLTSEITVTTNLVAINPDGSDTDFVFGSDQLGDSGDAAQDSRMFFDKGKGAFRAGTVTDGRWDDVNVGLYSVGLGLNNMSSGDYSFSAGHTPNALGFGSAAIGYAPTASGVASFAAGQATASAENTFAVGDSLASGYRAASFGGSTASGDNSISGGIGLASADGSAAFGRGVASGLDSTAFGRGVASGDTSAAFGAGTATAVYCFAAGNSALATTKASAAFGNGQALDSYSFAAGLATASGYGAFAAGDGVATGKYSFAVGQAASESYYGAAFGRYNVGGGDPSAWVATDPLFEIGMGSSAGATSNAFVVYKNGNAAVAGTFSVSGDPTVDLHAMNKGYADANYATPGAITATSNGLTSAFIAADTVVSNAFIAADTLVNSNLTVAYVAADTTVSNGLTTAYTSADTTTSNGLTTAYADADTVVSNALIAAIAAGGGGGGTATVPVSPYALEFAYTFDGISSNDWWGSNTATISGSTQKFDSLYGGYLDEPEGTSSGYLETPSVSLGSNYTLFIRFYCPPDTATYASAFFIQETAFPSFHLWTSSGFNLRFYYNDVTGSGAITKDAWHTFAIVVESSSGMQSYLDGVAFSSNAGVLSPTDTLSLGNPFGGVTSDRRYASFYMWKRALSASEVTRLHTLEMDAQYGVQGLRRP